MDRREFVLASAIACSGLGALAVGDSCASFGAQSHFVHSDVRWVVYDSRFAAGRMFGNAAASGGRRAVAVRGDVTSVWLESLLPHWSGCDRSSVGAVAGLTTAASLFCLEQLAKDHWLSVVQRGAARADSALVSWVIASPTTIASWE